MKVISTRGTQQISALEAVLQGIARDGGLFVPEHFPKLDLAIALEKAQQGYSALSAYVLGLFLELDEKTLTRITAEAYASFDTPEVVPLRPLGESEHVMELTHGPTLAFKDMALQILPRLTQAALEKHASQEDILILTATSGDTGKAALEGFKDVPRTGIFVFYPAEGVSRMQRLQMITQEGNNTGVSGVQGNFDDAQTGVKALFADESFGEQVRQAGYRLSSANSINFGRLVPQVAYYVYAYAKLCADGALKSGEPVNFCVPTGNFGNILAGYYAKCMGVPIRKLICASNTNNVLTEFFGTGKYDANRVFHKTMSPSMDILISSNLERLLFELLERDADAVADLMKQLADAGEYEVPAGVKKQLDELFWADWLSEDETREVILGTFDEARYLMDPHTAVAQGVMLKYRRATHDKTPCVTVSTASPFKFTQDVLRALTGRDQKDAFEAAADLSELTGEKIPPQIAGLKTMPVLHEGVVGIADMGKAVLEFVRRIGK